MEDRDLTVYSDGYYHPQTGPLVGCVVERDRHVLLSEGPVHADLPEPLHADSTAAEYWALGYAARRAAALWKGALRPRIAFFMDSKSVVEVILRASRVNAKYDALFPWVMEGLELSTWTLDWIPREENTYADFLSRSPDVRIANMAGKVSHRRRACEPRHIVVGRFAMADLARVLIVEPIRERERPLEPPTDLTRPGC